MHFTVVPIWAQTDILYLQAMGKLLLVLVLKEYKKHFVDPWDSQNKSVVLINYLHLAIN